MNGITLEVVEDIILGMAELVKENRYLRERNDQLEERVSEYQKQIKENYEQTQKRTADLLSVALANAHYRMGDTETAECLANKISE